MSVMSQIAMEREDALAEAHGDYQEAYAAMTAYMDKHPPAHRTLSQTRELGRLEGICGVMKYRYEMAKMQRYKV